MALYGLGKSRVRVTRPRRETGVGDRPTGSKQVAQVPYVHGYGPERIGFVEAPDKPRDSDTQGLGKSPGFRWPWQAYGWSAAPSVYHDYRPHWTYAAERIPANLEYPAGEPHPIMSGLPSRSLIAGERGPLDAITNQPYLHYYEQAPRHAWPGGGVIEYPQSVPVVSLARRLREPIHGRG